MSKIDIAAVATGLDKVLHVVNDLMPVAEALGGPMFGSMATLVSAATQIGENALERVQAGAAVAASRDEVLIRHSISDLQAINDKLNDAIAAS